MATQTASRVAAIPQTLPPTRIVRTTLFVRGSICETVGLRPLSTQTEPAPTATKDDGATLDIGIVARIRRVSGSTLMSCCSFD